MIATRSTQNLFHGAPELNIKIEKNARSVTRVLVLPLRYFILAKGGGRMLTTPASANVLQCHMEILVP